MGDMAISKKGLPKHIIIIQHLIHERIVPVECMMTCGDINKRVIELLEYKI